MKTFKEFSETTEPRSAGFILQMVAGLVITVVGAVNSGISGIAQLTVLMLKNPWIPVMSLGFMIVVVAAATFALTRKVPPTQEGA